MSNAEGCICEEGEGDEEEHQLAVHSISLRSTSPGGERANPARKLDTHQTAKKLCVPDQEINSILVIWIMLVVRSSEPTIFTCLPSYSLALSWSSSSYVCLSVVFRTYLFPSLMTVPESVWAAGPCFSCAGALVSGAGCCFGVSSVGPACLSAFESGTGTGSGRCGTGCGFCISDHAINWGPRIPSPVRGAGRATPSCARLTPLNRRAIVTSIVQCFICHLLLSCDKRRLCGRSGAIRPLGCKQTSTHYQDVYHLG